MQKITNIDLSKKILSSIISFFLIFSIVNIPFTNADFMEDMLEMDTELIKVEFNFYEIKKQNLRNKQNQEKLNKLIIWSQNVRFLVLRQYKNSKFWYYQMNWIVNKYNNFIYYSNKYFEALKTQEIYWKNKETTTNVKNNLRDMKFSYIKFKTTLNKKKSN